MAKRVKEMHSYVCSDLSKEFQRFDEKPEKYFKSFEGIRVRLKCSGKILDYNIFCGSFSFIPYYSVYVTLILASTAVCLSIALALRKVPVYHTAAMWGMSGFWALKCSSIPRSFPQIS